MTAAEQDRLDAIESYRAAGGAGLVGDRDADWIWREAAKLWRRKLQRTVSASSAHAWQQLGARR